MILCMHHKTDLRRALILYLPTYMQKLFKEIHEGISDDEVAAYVYDVVAAIANIEQIDYVHILGVVLSEGKAQVLTPTERDEWLRLMRYVLISSCK